MQADAESLIERARQARRENRAQDAKLHWSEAVASCRRDAVKPALARALCGLGQIERDLNRNDEALLHYEEAVTLYRSADNPLELAHAVRHVADILRHEKRFATAASHYEDALNLYRAHAETSPLDLANALRGWALLNEALGDPAQAGAAWSEARHLYSARGVDAGVKESEAQLAKLAGSRPHS